MTQRDRHEIAYVLVEMEDAEDELRSIAAGLVGEGPEARSAPEERLRIGTSSLREALSALADARTRLLERVDVPAGLPVAGAAQYLGVSEPTVRMWLGRGLLGRVPGAKPMLVERASLRLVGRALVELRHRGQDGDWTLALVDLLHDRAERERPELRKGLDELRRGKLEPA